MLTKTPASELELILCGTRPDAMAIRATGRRAIRVIADPSELYREAGDGLVLDAELGMFNRFVLAYPTASGELRDELAMRLGDTNCAWVNFGSHGSAAELVACDGGEALALAVSAARPMWTDEICTMDDVPEPSPEAVYEIGIKGLDDEGLRLVRPAFMPVIGPYGSGKSVLLRQLAVSLWKLHGWRTLMTSFEEKIKPRYRRDLRRHMIFKPMDQWSDEDVARADIEIAKAFRFLRRKRGAQLDLARLLDRIEYAVKVYGVDVVMIDPVNELDHDVGKYQSKTDYMGKFIMALKQLADDYNLLMIVAAHPPKDGVEKRLAKGKLLTLNDGADTAHWGNKADIGWAVWRPSLDGPTFLHVDKVKDHETMGKPTLAELVLDPRMNRFSVNRTGFEILGELVA